LVIKKKFAKAFFAFRMSQGFKVHA